MLPNLTLNQGDRHSEMIVWEYSKTETTKRLMLNFQTLTETEIIRKHMLTTFEIGGISKGFPKQSGLCIVFMLMNEFHKEGLVRCQICIAKFFHNDLPNCTEGVLFLTLSLFLARNGWPNQSHTLILL